MILMEFNLDLISQKSIKGQIIAYQLSKDHLPNDDPLIIELPDASIFNTSKLEECDHPKDKLNLTL